MKGFTSYKPYLDSRLTPALSSPILRTSMGSGEKIYRFFLRLYRLIGLVNTLFYIWSLFLFLWQMRIWKTMDSSTLMMMETSRMSTLRINTTTPKVTVLYISSLLVFAANFWFFLGSFEFYTEFSMLFAKLKSMCAGLCGGLHYIESSWMEFPLILYWCTWEGRGICEYIMLPVPLTYVAKALWN